MCLEAASSALCAHKAGMLVQLTHTQPGNQSQNAQTQGVIRRLCNSVRAPSLCSSMLTILLVL